MFAFWKVVTVINLDACFAVTSPDKMNEWNPMLEDYMDLRNSYQVDVDDAGVATVGFSKYMYK